MEFTNLVQIILIVVNKLSRLSWSIDKDDVLRFYAMYYSQRWLVLCKMKAFGTQVEFLIFDGSIGLLLR